MGDLGQAKAVLSPLDEGFTSLITHDMLRQRWKLKAAETAMLQALQYSMSFFDAEKSGALTDNDITWRGDSALTDALSGASLAGGFYDGANGKQLHA